jgi:hypothetical protein
MREIETNKIVSVSVYLWEKVKMLALLRIQV